MLDDFIKYIKNTKDLTFEIFTNEKLRKFVIDNDLFWHCIDNISLKCGADKTFEIFKILVTMDSENKFLNENIYKMFNDDYFNENFYKSIFSYLKLKNKLDINLISHVLVNKCDNINFDLIKYLYTSEYKNIIINNFESILKNNYYNLEIKELIKDDEKLLIRYNNYINNNPSGLIYELIIKGFYIELEQAKKEKIFDTIKMIIDELLQYENINYSDIYYIGDGAFNYVVSIGDKVLKLGQKREIFKIDNNKRFLKPILRTEINKTDNKEVLGCIEITEKANITGITEEDLYIIYRELRENGYYWFDCREANLGRLIKKNKIYFKELNPVKEAINYKTENNDELDKNELVIIDNDYIFTEEEFYSLPQKTRETYMDSISEYEQKYQEEKRKVL